MNFGLHKSREFLDELGNYQLLVKTLHHVVTQLVCLLDLAKTFLYPMGFARLGLHHMFCYGVQQQNS
jgi:hypothetical protein